MERPSIYVASPLGFTEPGRRYLDEVLHRALEDSGFAVRDPWADPTGIVASTLAREHSPDFIDALGEMNRTLGAANGASIAACDGVLAVVDGSDVDSGTAAEIGYAAALGVPVVGLRTDIRTSGDNLAATVNLQVEYFIAATGGAIYGDLDEAIGALVRHTADRFLFHLARRSTWEAAREAGIYTASTRDQSLAEVGFIHLSFANQLDATARRHYSDIDPAELVLLTVDRRRLGSRLVVELAPSVGEGFPHVFGPLNVDAVVAADPVVRDEDGSLLPVR